MYNKFGNKIEIFNKFEDYVKFYIEGKFFYKSFKLKVVRFVMENNFLKYIFRCLNNDFIRKIFRFFKGWFL